MRAIVVALALLCGCASLPDDGALICGADPTARCPAGFHCAGDGRCYRDGYDPDLAVVGDLARAHVADLGADAGP